MPKQAPYAVVKAQFGSKEKLAAQLASTMDIPEGKSKEQFQAFLKSLSNAKLLKLRRVEEQFQARFGGKTEKALSVIAERRGLTGKNAEEFKEKASRYSRAQLLDLAGPERKAKAS